MPKQALIAIDIETGPDETIEVPEPTYVYGNTKDAGKREIIKQQQRARQLDKRALSPYFCRVISLHIAHRGSPISDHGMLTSYREKYIEESSRLISLAAITDANADNRNANELATIYRALDYLMTYQEKAEATIVTFHGQNFDFPILCRRNLILGGKRPIRVQCGNRSGINKGHLDVGVALAETEPGGWNAKDPMGIGYTLFAYAQRLLGNTSPFINIPKTQYAEWHAAGNLAELQEAGDWDAARTLELAELFRDHYM